MNIRGRTELSDFGKRFPDAKAQLDVWLAEAERAQWKTPAEIKARYRSASILKGRRAVFNICGNKYRLVVSFDYKQGIGLSDLSGLTRSTTKSTRRKCDDERQRNSANSL